MKILGIDQKKCSGCGLCEAECAANLYAVNGTKKATYADPHLWCTGCGHCLSVCPADAIRYESSERARAVIGAMPDVAQTEHLLLSKRSVRRFAEREVPRAEIEKVLDVMRRAPSGHNAQDCAYVVITQPALQETLCRHTIDFLGNFRKIMRFHKLMKPFVPESLYQILSSSSTAAGIESMVSQYEAGDDPIFYQAPVLIAVHVADMGGASYVDPAIALTYGMLAAYARGLGSCWMGFTMVATAKNKKIHRLLDIKRGRLLAGVMTLGYPANNAFRRLPPRNDVNVRWFT